MRGRNGPLPEFSDPTTIDNPWYPVSELASSLLRGTEDGRAYRIELKLLPETRSITWQGGTTEVVQVRHRGFVAGEMNEEAIDYYAQGDDGGVWYFGEQVDNYKSGRIVDHEGAWRAGIDGAVPALLFPNRPTVGQVYFSEDLPAKNIVERDEVMALDAAVATPNGRTQHGVLIHAIQDDGTEEEKIYARGYGAVVERSDEGQVHLVDVEPS